MCTGVARANDVFSRGGLCQSGESGPAILPCLRINSVHVSVGEREGLRKAKRGEGATVGRCEEKGTKKRGKEAWTGVDIGCVKRRKGCRVAKRGGDRSNARNSGQRFDSVI